MSHTDQPIQPRREKPSRVWLAEGQHVSLGCGTLALIAIIVAIFSNKSSNDVNVDLSPVQSKLSEMDKRLQQLEHKIDQLDKKIKP